MFEKNRPQQASCSLNQVALTLLPTVINEKLDLPIRTQLDLPLRTHIGGGGC